MKQKVAIIGAGISGVYAARELAKIADVTVFEKSRGFGGRMATRTRNEYQFDHGTQYFTAENIKFKDFLDKCTNDGLVRIWNANIVEIDKNAIINTKEYKDNLLRYVATPKMSSLCKTLANGLNVKLETKIDSIRFKNGKWELFEGDASHSFFDWLILAIPSHQASELLPKNFVHLDIVRNIKMIGCYSLMLGFKSPLQLDWDAAFVKNSDIGWICVNSNKPGRNSVFTIVVQSTNNWAESHIEDNSEEVKQHLLNEISILGIDTKTTNYIDIQRWRYASGLKQNGEKSLIDFENKIAVCGDWCMQGRVEDAFESAQHLINKLHNDFNALII